METIKFGNYQQTGDKTKEAIEWKVLDIKNGKALLISKYALDCKPYHENSCNVTWENCTLRKWLNYEFINNAFSEEEIAEIVLTKNKTKGSIPTEDKVFLLSIKEVNTYLTQEERKCMTTPYAKLHNAWSNGDNFCHWWLRSPGYRRNYAAYVDNFGDVRGDGYCVNDDYDAVRVAMWVNSETLNSDTE